MKLIIKIAQESYNNLKTGCTQRVSNGEMIEALKNGIPLPKGHGRIMDVDKVIKKMEEREEQLKDDRSIWETAGVETALDMFGETIIEADKAESKEQTE